MDTKNIINGKIVTVTSLGGFYHLVITTKRGKLLHYYTVKYLSDVAAIKRVLL